MAGADATCLLVGQMLARPGHGPMTGPAAIRLAGGKIVAIDLLEEIPASAARLVALPAPANAHDHGRGLRTLSFGAADDTLEVWLPALSREPMVDPYLRAVVAFARMAEGGICAANHCHNTQDPARLLAEAEGVSRAAREVGIRIAFAVPFVGRNPVVYGDLRALLDMLEPADGAALSARLGKGRSLAEGMALTEAIAALEHDYFRVQYGPVGPQWVDDETLAALAAASVRTGRRIHMHLFETRHQREWADRAYPSGLIAHLDAIGFLSPRLTLAHAVWLDRDESALLARRGVSLSVNTSSNLRLRSGSAPVDSFCDVGLNFGLGLDGMSFDDDEDMLREIRLFWHLQRGVCDADVLTPARLFDAVNIDGRETIVGRDGGGRLEIGAPADLILLDLAEMAADVVEDDIDPLALLLTRMTKRHLRLVVVGGKIVVRDGRCVTVDRPKLERELHDAVAKAKPATDFDGARLARLQEGIRAFYRCGCHRASAATSPPMSDFSATKEKWS